jgi:ParB/RepB/Spo0J family partition protein
VNQHHPAPGIPDALLQATLPPEGLLITAPWGAVHDSPFQYRKTHNEARLEELTENIRSTGGIHQPILARRRFPNPLFPDYNPQDGLEIVAGHRRKLAGIAAGLPFGPVLVKDLTDDQARRVQITENLQRDDVHPIEEAEGFQELIDRCGETAESIAATLGKSLSYVYGRLKLLALCPEVRKACLAGEIGAESALLLARLRTDKLQALALTAIRGKALDLSDGGKTSHRRIRDLLNERFTLEMKTAIFDPEAEALLPAAGKCSTCPKLSRNAPEYVDIATEKSERSYSRTKLGPDVCTDPDCFAAKKKAHLKLEAGLLAAKGKTVVDGNKARQAIGADGKLKDGYVPLADVRDAIKKASKDKPMVAVLHVQDPRSGKVVQAVKHEDLVAAGIKRKAPQERKQDTGKWERERLARDAAAALESKVRMATLLQVRDRVVATERSLFDLRLLASVALAGVEYGDKALLKDLCGYAEWQDLEDSIQTRSADQVSCLMVDIALVREAQADAWDLQNDRNPATFLLAAAAHYGVDVDQVRAEVTGSESPPASAARAPRKAKAAAPKKTASSAALAPVDDDACLERTAKHIAKAKGQSKGKKQTDDAGDAGGRDAQVDAFEEAGVEA